MTGRGARIMFDAINAPAHILATPERLRVEDLVLLNDAGAFEAYGKSEVLDGEVYVTNAQWSRHARIKPRLATELALALRERRSDLEMNRAPSGFVPGWPTLVST